MLAQHSYRFAARGHHWRRLAPPVLVERAMSILKFSHYKPARGGHAPGDLRDAFCAAIDEYREWDGAGEEPTVELRQQAVPISAVCGLLWNCSDILPGGTVTEMEMVGAEGRMTTYATAARELRQMVATTKTAA